MTPAFHMASNRPAVPHAPPSPRLTIAPMEPAPAPGDFDALFRRYASQVGSIALRILGRRAEADDIVQETFVQALRAPERLADVRSIQGWLITIAVRLCRKRLRRRRLLRVLGFDRGDDYLDVADAAAPPDVKMELRRVYSALDKLSPPLRLAWTLRHIAGETLPTVAELCGCSLATAKRRIAAAAAEIEKVSGP